MHQGRIVSSYVYTIRQDLDALLQHSMPAGHEPQQPGPHYATWLDETRGFHVLRQYKRAKGPLGLVHVSSRPVDWSPSAQ